MPEPFQVPDQSSEGAKLTPSEVETLFRVVGEDDGGIGGWVYHPPDNSEQGARAFAAEHGGRVQRGEVEWRDV